MDTQASKFKEIEQGLLIEFPAIQVIIEQEGAAQQSSFIDITLNEQCVTVEKHSGGYSIYISRIPSFEDKPDFIINDHIIVLARLIQIFKERIYQENS